LRAAFAGDHPDSIPTLETGRAATTWYLGKSVSIIFNVLMRKGSAKRTGIVVMPSMSWIPGKETLSTGRYEHIAEQAVEEDIRRIG
jgi:hypothetical protein